MKEKTGFKKMIRNKGKFSEIKREYEREKTNYESTVKFMKIQIIVFLIILAIISLINVGFLFLALYIGLGLIGWGFVGLKQQFDKMKKQKLSN